MRYCYCPLYCSFLEYDHTVHANSAIRFLLFTAARLALAIFTWLSSIMWDLQKMNSGDHCRRISQGHMHPGPRRRVPCKQKNASTKSFAVNFIGLVRGVDWAPLPNLYAVFIVATKMILTQCPFKVFVRHGKIKVSNYKRGVIFCLDLPRQSKICSRSSCVDCFRRPDFFRRPG